MVRYGCAQTLTSKLSEDLLIWMHVVVTILGIFLVTFILLYMRHYLKDAKEGDLIDVGFGEHIEYDAFRVRAVLALAISLLIMLIGLFS